MVNLDVTKTEEENTAMLYLPFVPIGPFSAGTALGAIATLVGAGVPFVYRYVWGARSRISISRFSSLEDSEWRDGRNNDRPVWSRRIIVRASNNGWRDGVITDVRLEQVIVWNSDGEQAFTSDLNDSIHKIELEHFSATGGTTRLSPGQRTDYGGQIVEGRDDELFGILPFILRNSDLGNLMQAGNHALFTFAFTVEDNNQLYDVTVDVDTELTDSAGGELR